MRAGARQRIRKARAPSSPLSETAFSLLLVAGMADGIVHVVERMRQAVGRSGRSGERAKAKVTVAMVVGWKKGVDGGRMRAGTKAINSEMRGRPEHRLSKQLAQPASSLPPLFP
jgi:hypothetical protein